MAALNFFDGFNATWAQDGSIYEWTAEQYKAGWSVIGDTKPSVEQFNNTHQIIDQKANYLFRQLQTAAADRNVPIAGNRDDTLLELLNKQRDELLSAVYPVGAIYMNASSATDPNTFLPGTWSKITSGFLYSHGATQAGSAGSTGGASSIKLTVGQLPEHSHGMGGAGGHSHTTGSAGSHAHTGSANSAGAHSHSISMRPGKALGGTENYGLEIGGSTQTGSSGAHSHSLSINSAGTHSHSISTVSNHTHTISNTGNGDSINIMPPRMTVYMWKRVS